MKVAIIGANGQLGVDLSKVYRQAGHHVLELNHSDLDIVDFQVTRKRLGNCQPDLVINTAAMHHLDKCENDPDQSFQVNGIGVRHLALLAEELGFALVQISTDYVFNGAQQKPYVETDSPLPLNVYGNTKLAGELFVRSITPRHFVVRVSGLFGAAPCRAKGGLNFIRLMLKLASEREEVRVVADEALTPTYTLDIARQLEKLTATEHYGLYHMTAQGSCSWYEFAAKIFLLTGTKVKLSRAGKDEFPARSPGQNIRCWRIGI